MKNVIIALILTLSVLSVNAQGQSYYNGATAKGSNVTYNCEYLGPVVTISNVNNRYNDVKEKRSDGVRIPIDATIKAAKTGVFREIIAEVIPNSDHVWWDDIKRPGILATVNTNGDIIEVRFVFRKDLRWGTIHPDTYFQIEQKLKQRMKFVLTDDDKKQNIIKVNL